MIEINDKVIADTMRGFQIPPKPAILDQIQQILDSKDPNIADLAKVVAADVGVSSTILKTINSPFYGMNRTISDVNQAVFILGMDAINALVTAIKLKSAFKGDCCISLELFWDNASEIANTMVFIGSQLQNKIPPEELYSLGLFHDTGIPAMAYKYPEYVEVLQQANENEERTLVQLEEKTYPTNHAIVGYFLANSWNLPKNICQMVLHHHDLDFINRLPSDTEKAQFAVLKMAENIVFYNKRFSHIPEWNMLKEGIFSALMIDDDLYADIVDDLAHLVHT